MCVRQPRKPDIYPEIKLKSPTVCALPLSALATVEWLASPKGHPSFFPWFRTPQLCPSIPLSFTQPPGPLCLLLPPPTPDCFIPLHKVERQMVIKRSLTSLGLEHTVISSDFVCLFVCLSTQHLYSRTKKEAREEWLGKASQGRQRGSVELLDEGCSGGCGRVLEGITWQNLCQGCLWINRLL